MTHPRRREVTKYPDQIFEYSSLEEVLCADPKNGIHTFPQHLETIDLLYRDYPHSKDVLLVTFPAATNPERAYPFFSGSKLSYDIGASLLAFSDPSVAADVNIRTNWCIGVAGHDFPTTIVSLIRHFAKGRRVILFGSSAGGFPALRSGIHFPEALSFVVNPRTNLLLGNTQLSYSKSILFPNMTFQEIDEQKDVTSGHPRNPILYCQNVGDTEYFSNQMIPFVQDNGFADSTFVYWGNWGSGHVNMPEAELRLVLKELIASDSWQDGLKKVGTRYTNVRELQSRRADFSDKIKK